MIICLSLSRKTQSFTSPRKKDQSRRRKKMNDVRAANDAHQLAVMRDGNAAKTIPHHPFGHLTDLILRVNRSDRFGHHVGGCKAAGFLVNSDDILRLDKRVEYRRRMRSQTNFFLFQKKIAIADHADYLALAAYDRRPADTMLPEQAGDLLKWGVSANSDHVLSHDVNDLDLAYSFFFRRTLHWTFRQTYDLDRARRVSHNPCRNAPEEESLQRAVQAP